MNENCDTDSVLEKQIESEANWNNWNLPQAENTHVNVKLKPSCK